MQSRIVFFCVFAALCSSSSSLSCRWMDHKFRQFSENSFNLLDMMANNSTNTTEDEEEHSVAFPHHLYNQASKASAEDKVALTVQVLKEVSALFEEDDSSSSWEEEVTVENFLSVVNQQADELQLCIGGHAHMKKNPKLQKYFKRLSNEILRNMGYSAEAWEMIRREVKGHLIRSDRLISSLLTKKLKPGL